MKNKDAGWYVIQVQGGREDTTIASIEQLVSREIISECFTPRWQTQKKVRGRYQNIMRNLIPGYIICVTDRPDVLEKSLKSVPYFTHVLSSKSGFVPLNDSEVIWIKKYAQGKDHVIPMSEAVKIGEEVIITAGPLRDRQFKIVRINRHKSTAYIEISFLGRKKEVPIGLKIVAKKDN